MEQARFKYDALGRRVEKVAGGVTTAWTYQAEDILREVSGSTTLKYIHGPGIDEPLAVDDGSALSYLQGDALGSITTTTSAAGTIVSTRQYDPWGGIEIGAANSGFTFAGREWDAEIGLFHNRARSYDARVGRFASEDPIGLIGGLNLYAYGANGPATWVDPFGFSPWLGLPPGSCMLMWGYYARTLGPDRGGSRSWRYPHCMASCLIGQDCGHPPSVIAGAGKEVLDLIKCAFTRDPGSCDSALQPTDKEDNFTGGTCPKQMDCWTLCEPLRNKPEPPPGPFWWWGK